MQTKNIIFEEINKNEGYVILEGGVRRAIQKTQEGEEYISLKNKRGDAKLGLYLCRVKDAIEDIRNGYGHALINRSTPFGGSSEVVAYFLDEEVGEEYRKKTIEGFKGTNFAYAIRYGNSNSFNSYMLSDKGENYIPGFDENEAMMYFDSFEEAEKYINAIKEEAENIYLEYNQLKEIGFEEDIKNFIKNDKSSGIVKFLWHNSTYEDADQIYLEPIQTIKH